MKRLLLLPLLVMTIAFSGQSQTCVTDTTIVDSTGFVFPSPYDPDDMTGGIEDTACINRDYETVISFRVPTTLNYLGTNIAIFSMSLDTEDPDAIEGLPVGLTYACNPPSCFFDSKVDSLGCAVIYGTPVSSNTPGDFPLVINVKVNSALGELNIPFPNDFIPNADGEYTVHVRDENDPACGPLATVNPLEKKFSTFLTPNPSVGISQLTIEAQSSEQMELAVFNMMGKKLQSRQINVQQGTNQFTIDGSELPIGLYLVSIGNNQHWLSQKMVIQQ